MCVIMNLHFDMLIMNLYLSHIHILVMWTKLSVRSHPTLNISRGVVVLS